MILQKTLYLLSVTIIFCNISPSEQKHMFLRYSEINTPVITFLVKSKICKSNVNIQPSSSRLEGPHPFW